MLLLFFIGWVAVLLLVTRVVRRLTTPQSEDKPRAPAIFGGGVVAAVVWAVYFLLAWGRPQELGWVYRPGARVTQPFGEAKREVVLRFDEHGQSIAAVSYCCGVEQGHPRHNMLGHL